MLELDALLDDALWQAHSVVTASKENNDARVAKFSQMGFPILDILYVMAETSMKCRQEKEAAKKEGK